MLVLIILFWYGRRAYQLTSGTVHVFESSQFEARTVEIVDTGNIFWSSTEHSGGASGKAVR